MSGIDDGRPARYHHGDLSAALVAAGRVLLAETGPARFSVAELARRAGVSTTAPYRHFAGRDRLLAAVVTGAADDLATDMERAADAAGPGATDRLAAAGGAYAEVVARDRVGVGLIFAPRLRGLRDESLARAGRRVTDALLIPSLALTAGPQEATRLAERVVTLAHGYAALDVDDYPTGSEPLRRRATRAIAALVRGSSG